MSLAQSLRVVLDSTLQTPIPIDSLAVSNTYDGATPPNLLTSTVGPDRNGAYYKQTFTYTGANKVATASGWVKQ